MLKKDRVTILELLIRIFGAMAFIFIVSCIIFPFAKGVPIIGLPKAENIAKIEITDTVTQTSVTITDSEEIWYTKQLTDGMLMYIVNSSENSDDIGYLVLKFEDKNGKIFEISATETEVFWKGKSRHLKKENLFVDVMKNLYFK
ncbi:MAG: hypothetical protein E7483_03090 [Ruminococcaceae bacterium]|nr:hypothetical protein [Oscillospiraceae bacterium]